MNFIAHRGYSRRFPENSLQAFEAVVRHPQNGTTLLGIELDIHLTADGRIPVMHDMAMTDEHGRVVAISELTLAELRKLFSAQHGDITAAVPTIEQTLDLISHQTELCFEIKQGSYDLAAFTERFVEFLEYYAPRGDVAISTFSEDILRFVMPRTRHLDVRYAFVFDAWKAWDNLAKDVRGRLHYIHPKYTLVLSEPERLAQPHLPVQCWTVDSKTTVQAIIDLPGSSGIRSIMTNDIELSTPFAG